VIAAHSDDDAETLVANALLENLVATRTGKEVHLSARGNAQQFERRLGQWRITIEQLSAERRAPEPVGPQKIRIYGLDGGTKEIPFPAPPPQR
jgi:hypothetical protein